MAAVELDNALQAIISSKGGIPSGTKIKEVAQIFVDNVQSESLLIQKLYLQFRKAPSTHKIGLLYIVDLVLRDLLSQAKKNGQDKWPSPQDGTHMAGFNRLKEVLPGFLNDVLLSATEDQKERLRKLIDIWERGNILPQDFLAPFKSKLASAPSTPEYVSTTPTGSPPPNAYAMFNGRQAPANPAPASNTQSTASILQALAQMAKQNQPAAPPAPAALPAVSAVPAPQAAPPTFGLPFTFPPSAQQQPTPPVPVVPPPAATPTPPANPLANLSAILGNLGKIAPQQTPSTPAPPPQIPQFTPAPAPPPPPPPAPVAAPTVDPNVQAQQLALLQLLLTQPQLAATLSGNPAALAALLAAQQPAPQPAVPSWQQQAQNFNQELRDSDPRGRYSPPPRSPPHRNNRFRSRSRSPPPGSKRPGSPISFRRRSPVYGEYNKEEQQPAGRGGRGGRGRGGAGAFRRGSPDYGTNKRQRSKSPATFKGGAIGSGSFFPTAGGPKRIDRDPTIGKDSIRVYSRTLFVGGVNNISDHELREIFEKFGRVQSCIVNHEKRHAFIKMFTREDAAKAKEGMNTYRHDGLQLRTRWGVGFGPRDCSDYETGISVVPIDRLTDADKRWVVNADFGGTGGIPLEGGMVIEEPDIEIGQGVSSKAISKKREHPHHHHGGSGGGGGHQQGEGKTWSNPPTSGGQGGQYNRRHEPHITGETGVGVPPPTPGFGMLPFQNFMMPPGSS